MQNAYVLNQHWIDNLFRALAYAMLSKQADLY